MREKYYFNGINQIHFPRVRIKKLVFWILIFFPRLIKDKEFLQFKRSINFWDDDFM